MRRRDAKVRPDVGADGETQTSRASRFLRLYDLAAAQLICEFRARAHSDLVRYDPAPPPADSLPTPPSIALFLPAFNEAANIARTVEHALEALHPITSHYKVIVVDDGSTDGTAKIVTDLAGNYPDKVLTVGHVRNRGYGAALQTGFQAGLRTGYDWVGFVDADGQFDIGELGLLFDTARVQRAQFVAGYRVARADRWSRRQLGHAWDELTSRIVHHGLRDVDCGFKIVHRDVLRSIHLSGTYASISPELAAKARRAGAPIAQVGVTHYPRLAGTSTGANLKVVMRSLRGLVELRREIAAESA